MDALPRQGYLPYSANSSSPFSRAFHEWSFKLPASVYLLSQCASAQGGRLSHAFPETYKYLYLYEKRTYGQLIRAFLARFAVDKSWKSLLSSASCGILVVYYPHSGSVGDLSSSPVWRRGAEAHSEEAMAETLSLVPGQAIKAFKASGIG